MKRATPIQMRQSLKLAQWVKEAGLRFVPVPVFSEEDYTFVLEIMQKRLEEMIDIAEEGSYEQKI